MAQIEEKWMDLSLPKEQFDDLIRISGLTGQIEWNRFLALAASLLTDVSTTFTGWFEHLCQNIA